MNAHFPLCLLAHLTAKLKIIVNKKLHPGVMATKTVELGLCQGIPEKASVVAAHLLRHFSTMQLCGVSTVAREHESEI